MSSRTFRRDAAFVALLSLAAAYARWLKLSSLASDDPGMWLNQVARAVRGELPYRDFSWNYPPLSLFVMAGWDRLFGVTFEANQVAIDLLSLVAVALAYVLVRMLLPRALQLATVALLIAIGATALTKFTLFSLLTYSPSLLAGTIGLEIVLIGALLEVRGKSGLLLLAAGTLISAWSKPEPLLAAFGTLALLVVLDLRRWRRLGGLMVACGAVVGLGYGVVAYVVGWQALKDGVLGYGLATFACPWWPTGIGVLGAIAALGQGAFGATAISFRFREAMLATYGRWYRWMTWFGVPGLLVAIVYYVMITPFHPPLDARKLVMVGQTTLGSSQVLLPVMWVAILYWLFLLLRVMRTSREEREALVLLTAPVLMSTRSLFGTTLFPYTEVSAICYLFFIIVGPYLLWRFLGAAGLSRYAVIATATVCVAYVFLRIGGGYSILLSNSRYTALQTNSGAVRLLDDDGSAEIYRYVAAHTGPDDTVVELPYGGGIDFAAARKSPVFTTEFTQLRMPDRYQQQDLARILAHPPAFVVVDRAPNYGTTYGYKANMRCPCPRIVWEPDEPSWDPNVVNPIVPYIEGKYLPVLTLEYKMILGPR
ncbi:MAG TPA: hypothetical protein VKU01_08340 [Bryobacteraceae bacterium]|nr:hypothetical protein [Bryobacteraceae bacterium]